MYCQVLDAALAMIETLCIAMEQHCILRDLLAFGLIPKLLLGFSRAAMKVGGRLLGTMALMLTRLPRKVL
jgi:hypothetical protein